MVAALDAGEIERADQMFVVWAHLRRRNKTLSALADAVATQTRAQAEAASDAAMCKELSPLLGRMVEI